VVLELFISLLDCDFLVVHRPAVEWLDCSVVAIVVCKVDVIGPDFSKECDIAESNILNLI
jgi:hypothetical protein